MSFDRRDASGEVSLATSEYRQHEPIKGVVGWEPADPQINSLEILVRRRNRTWEIADREPFTQELRPAQHIEVARRNCVGRFANGCPMLVGIPLTRDRIALSVRDGHDRR